MHTVSSDIDSTTLKSLLSQSNSVLFEDSNCIVTANDGSIIGDSPYGYVDFMMPAGPTAFDALLMWTKSWTTFSPSCAFY